MIIGGTDEHGTDNGGKCLGMKLESWRYLLFESWVWLAVLLDVSVIETHLKCVKLFMVFYFLYLVYIVFKSSYLFIGSYKNLIAWEKDEW